MSVAARQSALARFLNDPEFEQQVRANPRATAALLGLRVDYIEWLATVPHQRVAAFRASQRVKQRRRSGGP